MLKSEASWATKSHLATIRKKLDHEWHHWATGSSFTWNLYWYFPITWGDQLPLLFMSPSIGVSVSTMRSIITYKIATTYLPGLSQKIPYRFFVPCHPDMSSLHVLIHHFFPTPSTVLLSYNWHNIVLIFGIQHDDLKYAYIAKCYHNQFS